MDHSTYKVGTIITWFLIFIGSYISTVHPIRAVPAGPIIDFEEPHGLE